MSKPATTALVNFLNSWDSSTSVSMVDLYVFTLVSGEVFRYSGGQTSIVAPLANTSSPAYLFSLGPRFERTKTKVQIGPHIDELEVTILASQNDILGMGSGGTLTWQQAFWHGLFDGGYVELLRAFISPSVPFSSGNVVGTLTWFYGRVGDIEIGESKSILRVKSLLDLLTVQMPPRLWQSSCNHVFGQTMCGYDRVNGRNALGVSTGIGQVLITCQTGSNQGVIMTTFVPSIAGSYDNGSIIGVSGLNTGFTRTIGKIDTTVSPAQVHFLKPWVFSVVAGADTFHLLPGCDHTLNTCINTFQNQAADGHTGRYGGEPYIPPPESAV